MDADDKAILRSIDKYIATLVDQLTGSYSTELYTKRFGALESAKRVRGVVLEKIREIAAQSGETWDEDEEES